MDPRRSMFRPTSILLAALAGLAPPPYVLAGPAPPQRRDEPLHVPFHEGERLEAPARGWRVDGRIVFVGDPLAPRPRLWIPTARAVGCCPPGESIDDRDRALVIGPDGGIANVVVTVRVPDAEIIAPRESRAIELWRCRFEPHVLVVPAGTTISFVNSDQVAHDLRVTAQRNPSYVGSIAPGALLDQRYFEPERMRLSSDSRPWMSGWLVTADTPYFAVTGPDGRFRIEGVEPGAYTLEYWHEDPQWVPAGRRTVQLVERRTTQVFVHLTPEGEVEPPKPARRGR